MGSSTRTGQEGTKMEIQTLAASYRADGRWNYAPGRMFVCPFGEIALLGWTECNAYKGRWAYLRFSNPIYTRPNYGVSASPVTSMTYRWRRNPRREAPHGRE
jgi:hypothetical protein